MTALLISRITRQRSLPKSTQNSINRVRLISCRTPKGETAMTETILVEPDGPVTIISINRPERRNAVDGPTARTLFDAFRAFDADPDSSVAVFTGTNGVFCAGADLKAYAAGDRGEKRREIGGYNTLAPMGPSRL